MDPRDVPILVLGFNRPKLIAELFAELRELKPRKIYYAVDGPRPDRDDQKTVDACRELVSAIDWPCEVQTRFSPTNLGCGRGVSSAIAWFFEHEEEGIILEDDIRPDPSFYPYVAQMLDKYRDDARVFAITGTNLVPPEHISMSGSYRFSRIPVVWGWASWRRSWRSYTFNLDRWYRNWGPREAFSAMGSSVRSAAYWTLHFQLMAWHKIDTWDYQVVFAAMRQRGLTVTPNVNLVDNVGFVAAATHTRKRPDYLLRRSSLKFESGIPSIHVDRDADDFMSRKVYRFRRA